MKRARFSLRVLILLVSCASVLLGYAQWRRQGILTLCAELKKDGYVFEVPNDWSDYIWQRKPTVAVIVGPSPDVHSYWEKNWTSNEQVWTTSDPDRIERLKELGVVEYRTE